MKTLPILLALVVAMLLGGCVTRVEPHYLTTPLPLPPRPTLPAIPAQAMECLSDEAYRAIVERDQQRRDYAEQLEAVIKTTHNEQP